MARRAYGPHTAKSMACRVREWRWTPQESAILGRRNNACADAPSRSGSITAHPTRSAARPTGCCPAPSPTLTAPRRAGRGPSRCSTARRRSSGLFYGAEAEARAVGGWIAARMKEGLRPEHIGVFVGSEAEMDRARATVKFAGQGRRNSTAAAEGAAEKIAVGTMHLAKGLEFPAVAVMACDDEILPLQARIEAITDEADLRGDRTASPLCRLHPRPRSSACFGV